MKPICVPCQRFYRPKKNGTFFTEGMPVGNVRVPAGTERPDLWKPYKLWCGDTWKCQGCGHEIIVGCPPSPIAIQHEPDFEEKRVRLGATWQVNDC